jgi:hypothetical protein
MPSVRAPLLNLACGGLCVLSSACTAREQPTAPEPEDPVVGAIGPEGRGVTSPDGRARLTVPAGALPTQVGLTLLPASDPVPNPNVVPGTVYLTQSEGLALREAATLTLEYDPTAVPGALPAEAMSLPTFVDGAWSGAGRH